MLQLLRSRREAPADPDAVARTSRASATAAAGARRYVCVACGAHVADVGDELAVEGRTRHERVNPGVFVHRFVTLARAVEVLAVTAPTREFTWFVGYAWQILQCAGCTAHLGWRFVAEGDRAPATFYGVRLDQIREQGDAPHAAG